ncbi:MAG: nucleotide-binding universal stress UspA family protein [Saprospiraceae bacterium]|jgi:nucleotide-binding universal stress UspA family protein
MKKILFPTDFSKTSENAFLYALHIANRFGATISTVHTFTAPIIATTPMIIVEEMAELTEKFELQEYQKFNKRLYEIAIEAGFRNINIEHTLEYGLAVEEIIRMSQKQSFDMIIMGTDGAEGVGKWLYGSHAAAVMSKAVCPVLIIPEKAKYKAISRITYATNFEDLNDNIIDDLLVWVGKFDAELYFVHVAAKGEYIDSEQYANMAEISELAERYQNVRFKILYNNDILEELENYVEDEKIDILVMITHRYSFFKRLFNPSLTKQMTFETEVPLLVYQAPKD